MCTGALVITTITTECMARWMAAGAAQVVQVLPEAWR